MTTTTYAFPSLGVISPSGAVVGGTLGRTHRMSSGSSVSTGPRKSAVELLAESKAFYVKSETVRGRTQTLPLVPTSRGHRTRVSIGPIGGGLQQVDRTSILRRSTSGTTPQTKADVLQDVLRKLLDCNSPAQSQENITSNIKCNTDIDYEEIDSPISPPAEYAFCASASERRYTRSHSHSQPVSGSAVCTPGTEPSVAMAKSLPDLHTARNHSSGSSSRCYTAGSRSNKSTTSDVFSLNRDSGGDSSGRLTHRSEPVTRRPPWPDLRRDSGSSTQHSGSYSPAYYTNANGTYYDTFYDQNKTAVFYDYDKNIANAYYDNKPSQLISQVAQIPSQIGPSQVQIQIPPSQMGPIGVHYAQPQNANTNFYCRVTKHGYPVPIQRKGEERSATYERRTTENTYSEITRSDERLNDYRLNLRDSGDTGYGSTNRSLKNYPACDIKSELNENDDENSGTLNIILPPPPECCENYQPDGNFIETIIPPPAFEMENEIYESLEIKNVVVTTTSPSKPLKCFQLNDNASEVSFHENVAQQGLYQGAAEGLPTEPISLPYVDPELSPGPGTFKRQKCFRYKQKSGTNGRPILRSKSDISDRYRRNTNNQPMMVRKSCGGEISRSISHLEQFFEQLGLNSDAYDSLFTKDSGSSDSSSPVYFSDVSTVDSNRPVSANESAESCGGLFRSMEPPSIVERNARIIKWLCNCRKAQLATTTTTGK